MPLSPRQSPSVAESEEFELPRSTLPIATLRPRAFSARCRVIAGDMKRWLSIRWEWLQPRTVPLLAALAGLLLTLGAMKYSGRSPCDGNLALRMRALVTDACPSPGATNGCQRAIARRPVAQVPIRIVIEPLKPGGSYIELTLAPPDPR